MQAILEDIISKNKSWTNKGEVASYIPELAKGNPKALGICVKDIDDQKYCAGDFKLKFTIQSISKVVSLICALKDSSLEELSQKVNIEPAGEGFNSIVPLAIDTTHKPSNPMINAGAIATITFIKGQNYKAKFERIFAFLKKITNNPNLNVNQKVYRSEADTGDRNKALTYYMKSTGIIEGNIEELLNIYFKLCSVEVNCNDLANIGLVLANNGILPWNQKRAMSKEISQTVKAIMTTCGMYNESGHLATSVGIPTKSGVSGGILAAVPGKMGIGIVGPALNDKGNSVAGFEVLKDISSKLDLSIF